MSAWLMLALVLAGCSQAPTPTSVEVVTTIYPVHELARWVGGDRARLTLLVPPGVEAHSWEPSPQDLARLSRARLFVYNGAGLEPWVSRLVNTGSPTSFHRVEVTQGLDLIRRNGQPDPHVWLDPLLVAQEVETIRGALAQANPPDAATYEANARAARARLETLDRRFREGLASCQRRELVVSHEAFAYLARRYNLTLIALMGLSPEVEPSPTQLAKLVRTARRVNARTVFVENLVSPRLAETLARELGAEVRALNPVEGLTEAEARAGKNYWSLMEANLEALRAGLGCT